MLLVSASYARMESDTKARFIVCDGYRNSGDQQPDLLFWEPDGLRVLLRPFCVRNNCAKRVLNRQGGSLTTFIKRLAK